MKLITSCLLILGTMAAITMNGRDLPTIQATTDLTPPKQPEPAAWNAPTPATPPIAWAYVEPSWHIVVHAESMQKKDITDPNTMKIVFTGSDGSTWTPTWSKAKP